MFLLHSNASVSSFHLFCWMAYRSTGVHGHPGNRTACIGIGNCISTSNTCINFSPSGDTFCSNSSYFQFQTSCRESLFYKSVASKRLGLGIRLRFLGAVLWVHTVSDYYQLDGLLSPEDVALRERVRDVMETHVAPVMTKVSVLHETVALVLMQAREREFKVQWSETVQEECELEYI